MSAMKNKITQEQSKDTGLAITLILLLIIWFGKNFNFVPPAILVLVLTMTAPRIFKPLAYFWFGLAHLLGEVVSRALLTVVFFLLVIPVGFLRKLLGKDSMGLKKWAAGQESVFIERNHKFCASDLEKPF